MRTQNSLDYSSVKDFEENFVNDLNTKWKDSLKPGDRVVIEGFPQCYNKYQSVYVLPIR